jgi:putative holliday junction resolvase
MEKGRIMAFDYGVKRVGVAVSDSSRIFTFPVDTIPTAGIYDWITNYIKNENINQFVVGQPLHADDTPASLETHIVGFIRKLKKQFPHIPIARIDERNTSKKAFETILLGGVPKMKRRDKALIDKISASIILEMYLETIQS